MCVCMCVCVCVCVCVWQDQKTIASKSSCNVQTTILSINFTETKCSINGNMCQHSRLAKNKNTC